MYHYDMGSSFHYVLDREDGGPGSGNFGHAGRPGKRGGSAGGGGAKSVATLKGINALESDMRSMKAMKQGAILSHTGIASKKELLQAAKDGSISVYTDKYIADRKNAAKPKSIKNAEQERVASMDIEEKKRWVSDALSQPTKDGVRDCQMQKLIDKMEMYDTPQVVCKEDFDKYVSEKNAVVMFRSVKPDGEFQKSGEQIAYETMYDSKKNFMGEGFKGDGLYFSVDRADSRDYGPVTMRTALRKDAKIFEYDTSKYTAKDIGVTDSFVAAWAVCNGYHGMKTRDIVTGNDHYIMFNKAALIMCDELEIQERGH